MQPYLFPYIGYFQLINAVDKFIILDSVNYIKSGWINRNRILVNGKPHMFNFGLSNASSFKLIKDIELNKKNIEATKFIKTIDNNYRKAPCFDAVRELLFHICKYECEYISDFARYCIELVNNYLGIKTTIIPTSSGYNNELTGKKRIIEMCKVENADQYINPIGGIELYDKETFDENGISLSFLKTKEIEYQQFSYDFVPWLSIIDVMMFNTVEQIRELLMEYDLVKGDQV